MGIKKLFTFLNNRKLYKLYSYLNDLMDDLDLKKSTIIVGVDGNLYSYKYTYSYGNMLLGFYNQIVKFLSNGIIPFYIFDGGTFDEKEKTNMLRHYKRIDNKNKLEILERNYKLDNAEYNIKKKLEKNSIKIGKDKISLLTEMLDLLNIPYIFSHTEGEYLAVLLNKFGIVDFILTDDTDPIPAGAKRIIKFYDNNIYFLETSDIFTNLGLSEKEFIDFCILLGSDYGIFQIGMKPNDILNIITECGNIETIIKLNIIEHLNEDKLDLINKIRNIYQNSCELERNLFLQSTMLNNPTNNFNVHSFIDHNDAKYYSNIILEQWDYFIEILKENEYKTDNDNKNIMVNKFKIKINHLVREKKFNTKNIIKFLKNNIENLNQEEIKNIQITFEYLNTFGL